MTIVKSSRPKRPAKPAQATTIAVPRIVQHTPKGKAQKVRAPVEMDPEMAAQIAEFMARMVSPGTISVQCLFRIPFHPEL
jgi:hypothetical protein